jgi:hypothetical protein
MMRSVAAYCVVNQQGVPDLSTLRATATESKAVLGKKLWTALKRKGSWCQRYVGYPQSRWEHAGRTDPYHVGRADMISKPEKETPL